MPAVSRFIPGDLCEVNGGTSDCLVRPRAFLAQKILLRLVELKFRFCPWCEGGVTVLHAKAFDDVLRVVFLVDDDRSFFTATGYVHAEHPRHVADVRRLEAVIKMFLDIFQHLRVPAQRKNVVHVQRKKDKTSVILEFVNARARFKRAEPDFWRGDGSSDRSSSSGSAGDRTDSS